MTETPAAGQRPTDERSTETPLLRTNGLKKYFDEDTGIVDTVLRRDPEPIQAVDDVDLTLRENRSIGIIGESGCGKTTLLMTLIGLYEPSDGDILLDGRSTQEFDRSDWKEYRRRIQLIFQDPFNSLDPKMTVRTTLMEQIQIHGLDDGERRIHDVLERVELNPPGNYIDRRPRQLSGGEMQRVSIARALIVEPDIILADEPVSMLDVSTQAAVLNLLSNLVEEMGVSMIYISHDLSTVSYVCDTVNVMYLGRVVEQAPTKQLIGEPNHPYTQALTDAIPVPDPHENRERTRMEGAPRDPVGLGEGCRFRDRCPEAMDVCEKTPRFVEPEDEDATDRRVACHLYYDHDQ